MKWITGKGLIFCMCVLGAASVLAQVEQPVGEDPGRGSQELDSFFQSQMDSFQIVGLSACIIKERRVIWSGGYGWGDVGEKTPVSPDMLFGVGSVSKTVTVAALMHLWEQGEFTLDDDIDNFLPFKVRNPWHPDKPITFRMLLTHTSSISDMRPGEGTLPSLHGREDSEVLLEEVLRGFLLPGGKYYAETNYNDAVPGARYEYSNISFSLIGYIIERVSDKPFTVYCRENLFDPLKMEESTWRLSELSEERLAFRYGRDQQTGENRLKFHPTSWPGYMDGGLFTSINEFSNFLIMMANRGVFEERQVLRPATVDTILSLQHLAAAPPGKGLPTIGQALLWILSRAGSHEIFQMNGFGPSFFSEVYFDPKTGTGGAFFTTGQFSSFPALGRFVLGTFQKMLAVTDRLPQ